MVFFCLLGLSTASSSEITFGDESNSRNAARLLGTDHIEKAVFVTSTSIVPIVKYQ